MSFTIDARAGQAGCSELQIEPKLIEFVAAVSAPGTERFVAQRFGEADLTRSGVTLSGLSEAFRQQFDIVEENVAAAELRVHRLRAAATDVAIIASLKNQHETNLAHIWALLLPQGDGRPGPLQTDGQSNIFYVRGAQEFLWAVSATWHGGWEIDAHSIAGPYPWRADRQVVSR